MSKIRVYDLAKETGIDSKILTAKLIELGYDVKAYNSTLDDETAAEIRNKLGMVKAQVEEKRIQKQGRTTILRRRTRTVSDEDMMAGLEPALHEEPKPEEAPVVAVEPVAPPTREEIRAEEEPAAVVPEMPEEEIPETLTSVAEEEVARPSEPSEGTSEETPAAVEVKPAAAETEVPLKPRKEPEKARKGLARVIKKAAISIEVEEAPRAKAKKITKIKPKGTPPVTGIGPVERGIAGEEEGQVAGKGKKGKRFVKIQPEPGLRERGKRPAGKRKGGADVELEDVDVLGGRIPAGLKISRGAHRTKFKKGRHEAPAQVSETKAIKKRIKVFETISVGDLAHRMGIKASEVIAKLMGLGVLATLNQALDVETATLVAADFGYEVEQGITEEQTILHLEEEESGGELLPRPPVVTVMGHVDHGKTSILDAIRKTDVAAGEAGGITQHIGAHYVRSAQGDVVFLDTPGHAAFTQMRSRGAKVTDVVVLVVAADDGVMDQTKEAINHAKAANVPIVVAVNKIDKPDADPMRVKRELAELDLVPEDWGGQTIYCETSAKQNIGIDELLEQILLQAEVLELKADPKRKARGRVIEAQLHKGRGPVATVLVQEGTLRVGDPFVVGDYYGKVRSLFDDKGRTVEEGGPATPVEVHGLSGVPQAGDEFFVVTDEKMAKNISSQRQMKSREVDLAAATKISLENLFDKLKEGEVKELLVVLRADVQGTLEAFGKAIQELSTEEIRVKVIHSGTGAIIESDVLLAAASDALIIGFNVRPSLKVQDLAKTQKVDIRLYDVIYHALDDIKKAMVGMLEPTFAEKVIGTAEVRNTFQLPKIGTIAGGYVVDGKIERNAHVRVLRDGVVIYTGRISSLKRFKEDAREVTSGYECGVGVENYNDIKVGDLLEAFHMEEVAAEL